jgi:hypothetical protein
MVKEGMVRVSRPTSVQILMMTTPQQDGEGVGEIIEG